VVEPKLTTAEDGNGRAAGEGVVATKAGGNEEEVKTNHSNNNNNIERDHRLMSLIALVNHEKMA